MTAKEYLNQIRRCDRLIQLKLADMYRLENMAMALSVEIKADKVKSSGSQDKMANCVVKIVDMKNEVAELVDEYRDKRNVIIKQIDDIENDDYRDVLTERFILCRTFDEIPLDVNMSRRKVFYVYHEALDYFAKKYCDEIK